MTIRFNPRWLLVPVLLCSLQLSRAQVVLPPELSYDLGSTNDPGSQLWDLNGSYSAELMVERNGQAVPVEVAFTLIHRPNGQLTTTTNELVNAAVTFNNDNNSTFVCQANVGGKVTGFNGQARAHFTVHFAGNGFLGNQSTTIRGSLSVDAETDPSGHLFSGKDCKFSATFPGLSSIKGTSPLDLPLQQGVDGTWNLKLDLVGLNKVVGTGVIKTPAESLGVDLNGNFKNGLFVVKAKGANDVPNTVTGAGASATILIPSTFDSVQVNGKILGQKLDFNVASEPPQ